MKDSSNFTALMDAVCMGLGFCGSVKDGVPLHFTDLLPGAGKINADEFASLVFVAEGMDAATQGHREEIKRAFVQHMGSDLVDVAILDLSNLD
tara:strand:+ start:204 stop:482 length:279 start_codon:yes stop_codon:yes gene_type:complete